MTRLLRNLLLLVTCGLCSCTLTQLAYDHLDLLARHYVGGFVDLRPEQQQAFDLAFDRFWHWHRATELPAYADLVHAAADSTGTAQTPAQLDELLRRADALGDTLGGRVLNDLAPLVAQLDDAQVNAILMEIDRRIAKRGRRAAQRDDADWRHEQIDDTEDLLRKFAGPLQPSQRARIRVWGNTLTRDEAGLQRAAVAWRAQLAALLAHRRDADFREQLKTLMQPASAETVAAERRRYEYRAGTIALLADLSRSYTPAQRQHLHDSLNELADQLRALADEKA